MYYLSFVIKDNFLILIADVCISLSLTHWRDLLKMRCVKLSKHDTFALRVISLACMRNN